MLSEAALSAIRTKGIGPKDEARFVVTCLRATARRILNPLRFQWALPGVEGARAETYGYDATILIDLCKGGGRRQPRRRRHGWTPLPRQE